MEKEFMFGQKVINTLVNGKIIKEMVKEPLYGTMVTVIEEVG